MTLTTKNKTMINFVANINLFTVGFVFTYVCKYNGKTYTETITEVGDGVVYCDRTFCFNLADLTEVNSKEVASLIEDAKKSHKALIEDAGGKDLVTKAYAALFANPSKCEWAAWEVYTANGWSFDWGRVVRVAA